MKRLKLKFIFLVKKLYSNSKKKTKTKYTNSLTDTYNISSVISYFKKEIRMIEFR